jgi:hypothetical protein
MSEPSAFPCQACGARAEFVGVVPRGARCERCGADLRCCLNCRFHESSAYNECLEPSAERVLEKDRANFCDYFAARKGATMGGGQATGKPPPLGDLERLFSKK